MLHPDMLPSRYLYTGAALLVVTVLGIVVLVSGARRFDGVLLWLLGATTGMWLVVDHVHEISILWTVVPGHGLTAADLAAIPAVLVAAALALRGLLARHVSPGRRRPSEPSRVGSTSITKQSHTP